MKKFGFAKKDSDDSGRTLFGRKKDLLGPQSDNPYAQQGPADDPYSSEPNTYANVTPYQQARAGLPNGPRPGGPGGLPGGPAPRKANPYDHASSAPIANPPPYGASPAPSLSNRSPAPSYKTTASGADSYGPSPGYGNSRFDNSGAFGANQAKPAVAATRPHQNYGGMGRTNSTSTEDNRDALFSGARERYGQQRNNSSGNGYGEAGDGTRSGVDSGSYGGYGEQRELTAEEQADREVEDTKDETRRIRKAGVDSTRNALASARSAVDSSRSILRNLGAQGDRLHNTEKNLDLAANSNRIAEESTRELKSLDGSMFKPQFNIINRGKKQAQRDREIQENHQRERQEREATRQAQFASQRRMDSNMRELDTNRTPEVRQRADRSRFNFENTTDDERDEDEIEDNVDEMGKLVKEMNVGAQLIGREVDEHNKLIDRIAAKSDAVDDQVRMNREKLNRFK